MAKNTALGSPRSRARYTGTLVSALRYGEVCEALSGSDGVTAAKMFGAPGLRIGAKFFCCLHRGRLVVKLPPERANALVASGEAVPARHFFIDRPLTNWVEVTLDGGAHWVAIAAEARDFGRSAR